MLNKILRKSQTLLRDPLGGALNNYNLFRNSILPAALLKSRMTLHAPFIHPLADQDKEALDGLINNGYWITHIDEFCPEIAKDFEASLREVFQLIDTGHSVVHGPYLTHVDSEAIESRKNLLLFGLSNRILNIVENYIRLPIFYRGLTVRRDHADGQKIETRLWHKDFEDFKIVKVIVYASDVDDETGPYEIISKKAEVRDIDAHYLDGRVSDEEMAQITDEKFIKPLTGRRGTIIFTDTASCFHRGKVPISRDRDALFYAYNSTRPRTAWGAGPLYDPAKAFDKGDLTPRQRRVVSCPY